MADKVQFKMERMVDELDDLHKRGLFTRDEIAEIVDRRREFEYRIARPCPLKHDFLLYIGYETQLDALRILRKRKVIGEMAMKAEQGGKAAEKWKKSVSDGAMVRRILELFRLVTTRYRGDLEIWFRYLEYCREKQHGRMKAVLAQVLKFHETVPSVWIYAAAWQFDHNLNVDAARTLMLCGLRVCPKSEDLWIEYLRMELTYLNKLKARKVALGEDIGTAGPGNKETDQWKKENKELYLSLNEERQEVKEFNLSEGTLVKKDNPLSVKESEILQTVYHEAVKALPSSMSLRKWFSEVLDTLDFPNSDDLRKEVMEDFKRDFSQDELYWDWLAKREIRHKTENKDELLAKLNKAFEIFEHAITVLPTAKMFSLFVKFWLDSSSLDSECPKPLLSSIDATKFTSSILKVFEKAESNGCLTEDLACQYISFYLHIGEIEAARNLAERICKGELSDGAKLWFLRVSMELKWCADKATIMSKKEMQSVFKLLNDVLKRLSVSKAESLWILAMKTFSNDKDLFKKLVKSLIVALSRGDSGDYGFSISSSVVNCILERDGIKHAREMYKRFLALPHPSLAFFRNCIELELNLAAVGESEAMTNARKLYEAALQIYGQIKELWREYYMMEKKVGTSETAESVYYRAKKTLKDTFYLASC